MEDLKQTPPESIESDAASEYMRGYSDGLEAMRERINNAVNRANILASDAPDAVVTKFRAALDDDENAR